MTAAMESQSVVYTCSRGSFHLDPSRRTRFKTLHYETTEKRPGGQRKEKGRKVTELRFLKHEQMNLLLGCFFFSVAKSVGTAFFCTTSIKMHQSQAQPQTGFVVERQHSPLPTQLFLVDEGRKQTGSGLLSSKLLGTRSKLQAG
jgi:hypothetical protein